MSFPKDFTWGVAAAAYQIEGAAQTDGRAPSIWDDFCRQPGAVFEGHSGDVACDHYHRYREDIALMAQLGAKAYRLSISWPRVLPQGTGAANEKGLEFYDRLIDGLLEAGVTPWVTLYHWDLPSALQARGGWMNRDIAHWFADYATLLGRRLGDRVKHWMTINEPPCVIGLGMHDGVFAPGLKLSFRECLLGAHHLLLAHGAGVQALRAACPGKIEVSLALTARERIPATNSPADVRAAEQDYFSCRERNLWNLTWWADPIFLGHYPTDGLAAFAGDLPAIKDDDLKQIAQPLDFFGYNCYSGMPFRAGANGAPEKVPGEWGIGNARGTLSWLNVAPAALYWSAKLLHQRYALPVVFTENGFCNTDFVQLDGRVPDPQRIDFLERYLGCMHRAVAEGAQVGGYFYWSVMDNFEWKEGYKDRFGLVHVDYTTQKRTPKDSYFWYRDVIRSNGESLKLKQPPVIAFPG
jgi:beta-glucosidase